MLRDEIQINVLSGKGGDGIVHWRKEKFIPKGGPDGGDGGKGGDVYIEAIEDIGALAPYQKNKVYDAENGGAGMGALKQGKNGMDKILYVPRGSIIHNLDTDERYEVLKVGEKVMVAAGGKGGYGNEHFKNSRNTTPMKATKGVRGQKYNLHIELSLIGDIGIIGMPSAGKSTFLNLISNAKAKTASYHFTTLSPNLGVVFDIVFADIPGLIEGAATGKGLGYKFLKHIMRTKLLLHLVPLDVEDVEKTYLLIREELTKYKKELADKEEVILLTKTDLTTPDIVKKNKKILSKYATTLEISMYDDESIKQVLDDIIREYRKNE